MKYNLLGRSGAAVSEFALGTMTFGSEASPEASRELLDTYVEAGGTLIETADVYSSGESERIVGEWLAAMPAADKDRLFIASKGRFPVGVEPRDSGLSRRHLRRALDASLARMGVDHIDLYQVHAWDNLTPLEETIGFLDDAVRSGKIAYAGLSNFTGWQIALAASYARGRFPLVSNQPQYNLLVREVEWEIVPASVELGLGLLPWSPLGGGWLTGKYAKDSTPTGASRLGEDPARGVEAYDRRNADPRTWAVLDAVEAIATSHGVSMSQVALAWLKARDGMASVILGARTVAQLVDNLGAGAVDLTPEETAALDTASDPTPSNYPYGAAGIEQRTRTLD